MPSQADIRQQLSALSGEAPCACCTKNPQDSESRVYICWEFNPSGETHPLHKTPLESTPCEVKVHILTLNTCVGPSRSSADRSCMTRGRSGGPTQLQKQTW